MKLEIERLAYDGKVVLERINQKVEYGDFINLIVKTEVENQACSKLCWE